MLPQSAFLTPVFEHVFSEVTAEVTVLLEQQIFKCDFNQVSMYVL